MNKLVDTPHNLTPALILQLFPQYVGYLKKLSVSGKMSHAYCVCGQPEGGQNDLAGFWCQEILGLNGAHPDLLEINIPNTLGESVITVDVARKIKRHLSQKAVRGNRQVVLVQNAENLTTAAVNALLKVSEEPTTPCLLILTTAFSEVIPKTLLSRAARIVLPPLSRSAISSTMESLVMEFTERQVVINLIDGRYERLKAACRDVQNFLSARKKIINFWINFLQVNTGARELMLSVNILNQAKIYLPVLEGVLREILHSLIRTNGQDTFTIAGTQFLQKTHQYSCKDIRDKITMIQDYQKKLSQNANAKLIYENLLIQL